MGKYIATVKDLTNGATFEVRYDAATGLLETAEGEEIYDLGNTQASDKELVEAVYDLYNANCWEITDCIEYEDE